MAKARKKKKTSSRKRSIRKSSSRQAGFIVEGLRTSLSWVGVMVIGIASVCQWAARRLWDGVTGERARQPLGMALAAVSIFGFAAMLDYKTGAATENFCGTLGFQLADSLFYFLGVGAFVLPGFGALWGIASALRDREGSVPVRVTGVLILGATIAVISAGLSPEAGPNENFPAGRGGWLGHITFPELVSSLGSFGVTVLLSLLATVSLLLATEWAFVPLVKEMLRRGREGLVQQQLPLGADRKGLVEGAQANHAKASRGLRRFWQTLLGTGEVFVPAGEEPLQAGRNQPATDHSKSIPSNLSREEAAVVDSVAARHAPQIPEQPAEEKARPAEKRVTVSEDLEVAEDLGDGPKPGDDGFSLPGISSGPELSGSDTATTAAPTKTKPARARKPTLTSLPPIELLSEAVPVDRSKMQAEIDSLGERLQSCFDAFGLDARVVGAERGPTLTLFEVQLAAGVSVKKLKNQRDDMAVQLGSHGVRIVYPLPGRTTVGIEVPNLNRESVFLKDVFNDSDTTKASLPMVIGRDTLGKPVVEDLTKMPHMLVAGTTGSGKSVCLNSILMTMLLTRGPDQLRLILVDPKQVEMQLYADIPHLACPVVTDMKRAPQVIDWAVRSMDDRLHLFKLSGVRDIAAYNNLSKKERMERLGEDYDPEETPDQLPFLVIVIDELADLMMISAKDVEIAISRLAAKARAAGIHIIVATQRPSTDVVTGTIKMNLPVRIAFKVTAGIDSRVILDESGADLLLGNGDFLYRPPGAAGMKRGQGAFVEEHEVRAACDHLREHGKPEFIQDLVQLKSGDSMGGEVDDPLYDDAVRIVLQSGRGSASLLQRALSVGYTRGSRLVDYMTEQGVLGPHIGSKPREILVTLEEWEAQRAEA